MAKIYPRLLRPPDQSFFLFGARGTGKSTWARLHFPQAHWIDLLDEARHLELSIDPAQFSDELRALAPGSWVVVDEIQRIPSLLNEVHRFIGRPGLKFVLLGSSARKLKTSGTNLLAGRALRKEMMPLVPAELGSDFRLERVLRTGSMPVIWTSADPEAGLEAYVHLYLREEIRAEALVRNLSGFLRFLPVAGLLHGQAVNVSGVARDAGVSRTTVAGYLEILEDTLLASRLPAYEARIRVRERKHPKFYFIDAGIARAIKRTRGPLVPEERGPLIEGWVFSLLRAYAETSQLFDELYYWAPAQGGVEVDFLLRRGRELLAIEVKSQSQLTQQMTRGLRAVETLPHMTRRILVYAGRRLLRTSDGIDVMPYGELAQSLDNETLWP